MKLSEPVAVAVVQEHESVTDSNVRLGGYDMPINLSEVRAFRAHLETADVDRLFLLGLDSFGDMTAGRSWRARDVLPAAASHPRVNSFVGSNIDLRSRPDLAIVIVTTDAERGSLVIIDGNHRTMAQFLRHRTVQDVPAFVCVHPGISHWPFVPATARFPPGASDA